MKVYVAITYSCPGRKYSSTAVIRVDIDDKANTSDVLKHAYDDIFVPKLREMNIDPRLVHVTNWRYLGTDVIIIE